MEELLKELHFKQIRNKEWELSVKSSILRSCRIVVDKIEDEWYIFIWCYQDHESGNGLVCISRKLYSAYAVITIINWVKGQ